MSKDAGGGKKKTQIELVTVLALRAARRCVSAYGSAKSRKDFTQPQLVACLVLKAITRSNYRGVCELLELSPPLRKAIGLQKTPHWTTLQKFVAKPGTRDVIESVTAQVLRDVGVGEGPVEIAVDSTGLQSGTASEHYRTRRGTSGKARRYVKVSAAVLTGSLLPVAVVIDLGPSNDMTQMPALLEGVERRVPADRLEGGRLLADMGYDAEWVHQRCRDDWDCQSLIPAVGKGPQRVVRSRHRSAMTPPPKAYGRRWLVESYFSGLKRTTLGALSSRSAPTMLTEAAIKVLAYAVRR